jgi:hypothetical protein
MEWRVEMTTNVTGVVLRQREYWMGWPGAAYPVDQYEGEYPEQAIRMGDEVGVSVRFAETVYDEEGVTKFLGGLKANFPDGVLETKRRRGSGSLRGGFRCHFNNASLETLVRSTLFHERPCSGDGEEPLGGRALHQCHEAGWIWGSV